MDLLKRLVDVANETADGHLTIMRFTTNWRVGFFTPGSREDIDKLHAGKSFEEAATAAIEQARKR